jgi:plasmid maintenance system killer protein
MIGSFGDSTAREIWETDKSKALPRELHTRAKALLTIMHYVDNLADLKLQGSPPNVRLHKLKGNRKQEWSLTLKNDSPWRITFEFKERQFHSVKIENYH